MASNEAQAGRLGLLQSVSLNMAMMVGVGPFITIPLFVQSMKGPHGLAVWFLAALVAICDGMVWAELAGAFPGTGGTLHFYDRAYGNQTLGRLLKFLFVWQFFFTAPLELASGAIGFAQYCEHLLPSINNVVTEWPWTIKRYHLLAADVMLLVIGLAWRNTDSAGRLMVFLWVGMLITIAAMIIGCSMQADPVMIGTATEQFKDAVHQARSGDFHLWYGVGGALAIAMYDFLGYYQICYLGDEVKQPSHTIPRSILLSVLIIGLLYFSMNLGLFSVMPWEKMAESKHIASDAMQQLYGVTAGRVMTVMILWTALAATYAAMLGFSRVPYAAAKTGHFFRSFASLHPRLGIPDKSLLFLGVIGMFACLVELEVVINALLTSRIIIQFLGQIVTVFYIRKKPELASQMKFRMPLFPLPAIIAFVGWVTVFVSSDWYSISYGSVSLTIGLVAFGLWTRKQQPV